MRENEYECAECKGVLKKGWSEEEAVKEKEENNWGNMDSRSMAVVCDDCYKKIMDQFN